MTAKITIDGYELSDADADALRSVLAVGIRKTEKYLKITNGINITPIEHREIIERKCNVAKRFHEIMSDSVDE